MFKLDDNTLLYGSMPLDHLFIRDYLPAARGDYVKVYIYGLYLSQHPAEDMSLSLLARELDMTESETEAALRYWERRRLVSRLSDNPPVYLFRGAAQLALSGEAGMEADADFVAFSEDVYALFGDRRKIRPSEIAQAWEWVQDLKLPQDVVLMLLTHMSNTGHINFSFKKAEAEAAHMAEQGILTVEDAESYFSHSLSLQQNARSILRHLGRRRDPSEDEIRLYRKWTEEWQYSHDAILAACRETTKGEPTFAYLDGILGGIRQRAEKRGRAPRSAAEVESSLESDDREKQALRDFAAALGLSAPGRMLENAYTQMVRQYDPALVLLVAGEVGKAGGRLDQVEPTLEKLSAQGMHTPEEAQKYFEEARRLNMALALLLERSGGAGRPTARDRALYKKWLSWGFPEETILLAADQARGAGRVMPYMDKILEDWHAAGALTPEAAAARKAPAPAVSRKGTGWDYDQRRYTEEELENRTDDI